MICKNNYPADFLRVCEVKNLIWVMRFLSPKVYTHVQWTTLTKLYQTLWKLQLVFKKV